MLAKKKKEAEVLRDAARGSVTETQAWLDELNSQIVAERADLNEVIGSDIAVYQGIALDAVALALDVSVPGQAFVRRAACTAGKKLGEVYATYGVL